MDRNQPPPCFHLPSISRTTGFIPVGLFPRLGVQGTLADLLQHGADFLDRASSVSELRQTVWGGSIFPCANGAASNILATYALRHIPLEQISDKKETPKMDFRRSQTLHVLHCTGPAASSPSRVFPYYIPFILEVLTLLCILGVCTVMVLFGLYGTAAALFICVLFFASKQLTRVDRPAGYLRNNEGDAPGCMLVALHENASTWYLYIGSRAVIDSLLNKTMIESITSRLGENALLAHFWRILAAGQLVAMTYVAAQKGWDGVALLALVVVAWVFDWVVYSDDKLAETWLRHERVDIKARSFQFSGRTSMLGAIQVLSKSSVTSWMDGILAPSPRRDSLLSELGIPQPELEKALSTRDREWVDLHKSLVWRAVETINKSSNAGIPVKGS
ncbi:hypothetical protein B0T21DRAFT_387114 [Apiosordaria backusii]|uniref:Uncharacterized protein n=1 Tax=Apiosordaria backusii TaxID=314023 RepID=A0AA40AEH7_9PEZI|nr:hypothetical protein B0T21DRAFT_387114 [Apiosordaria backusii]